MRRLAELGHRSIAFLSAPRPLVADQDRLRRYRATMRDARTSHRWSCTRSCHPQACRRRPRACSGGADAPSAIVTNSDYAAHGVYTAARELGLEVGPQVSVVGHDDLPTSELLDPPLSTLRVDRREMGRELMVRLLDDTVREDYVAPVEYVERESVQVPFTERSRGGLRALGGRARAPRLNSVTDP